MRAWIEAVTDLEMVTPGGRVNLLIAGLLVCTSLIRAKNLTSMKIFWMWICQLAAILIVSLIASVGSIYVGAN